jgi:hypothetical protein
MSSGGDRKRCHDAVSDETVASAPRLTKQLKPPPAPLSAEPRPLCLLDLPSILRPSSIQCLVDMTVPPTTSTPENKCISVLYFSQVEDTCSLWIEWFGTDLDYRGKNLGIGTLLLQFVLDLAIIDEGVDGIYLEVGRDKEGKMENWKAAGHVYEKVGFEFMDDDRVPGEVAGCCKHFGDDYYNIMRFDCKGKATTRMSARRSTRRKIKK